MKNTTRWNPYEIFNVRTQKSRGKHPWNHPRPLWNPCVLSLWINSIVIETMKWFTYGIGWKLSRTRELDGLKMRAAVDDEAEELWKRRRNALFFMFGWSFWFCLVQFWVSSPELVRLPWYRVGLLPVGLDCWTFLGWFIAKLAAKMSWFGSRYHNFGWIPVLRFCLLNDFDKRKYPPTTWLSSWKLHNNIESEVNTAQNVKIDFRRFVYLVKIGIKQEFTYVNSCLQNPLYCLAISIAAPRQ